MKNGYFRHGIFLALLMCCFVAPALAEINQPPPIPPPPLDLCNSGLATSHLPSWSFTGKVVNCIKGSIITATGDLLQVISDYMTPLVSIMVVFALIILGARILNGERELTRTVVGFALRLGLVWMFYYNLGGAISGMPGGNLSNAIFLVEDQLVQLVNTGTGSDPSYTPWDRIDLFIGKIFGFGPQIVLFQGLLGLVGAALVSSTLGIILFLAGFMAIVDLLTFTLSVVFTFLMSYLLIAFMIIISPLIIPMALFFYTERYFQKWLAMLVGAMLTPVMLFAFLGMFMNIFSVLIAGIFGTLGFACPGCDSPITCDLSQCVPPDFKAFWKLNQPLFSWLIPGDPTFDQMLSSVTQTGVGDPAVQSNILPTARRALNTSMVMVPSIDFGRNNVGIMQKLVFQFISLWIFASLMKSMVAKIPDIAASIASTVTGIDMYSMSVKRMASETLQDAGIGAINMAAYQLGRNRGAGKTMSRKV